MGILLNPDNLNFKRAVNSEIYIDKSMLLQLTNKYLQTKDNNICVSRPRRFGKSTTADMLVAYYSRGCNSAEIFDKLKISKTDEYLKHLNQYNVIHINMTQYIKASGSVKTEISSLTKRLLFELHQENRDVNYFDSDSLIDVLNDIFAQKQIPFIFVIDEWDCIFREHKDNTTGQKQYLDFLRDLLKDQTYVALAYMTGILPIKKYGKHSALNMFTEISMTNPRDYAEFTGFTEQEVKDLCDEYEMSYEDTKYYYDGYYLKGIYVYNPRSVVMAMTGHEFSNYWTSTETFKALEGYIHANFKGLRDKVVSLIAYEPIEINTAKFQNDMTSLASADDILTLLVHLGYLTFRPTEGSNMGKGYVSIPNAEVRQEFINCIEDDEGWDNVMSAIRESDELLQAVLEGNSEAVAVGVEKCHYDNTSILKYNDENSLSCVISLAFYSARKHYAIIREMPTGKGFADLVFLPLPKEDKPALVVELKQKDTANTAIEQIHDKHYPDQIKDYVGNVILVGISYDGEKRHECVIEKIIE